MVVTSVTTRAGAVVVMGGGADVGAGAGVANRT